ncbi:MAG: hypothetical protein B7733_12425 [Myxococcales bacterium FL481]|nr:MAG: hypothetical protein B7733_12425 [Myxococcales bacterium FL481]
MRSRSRFSGPQVDGAGWQIHTRRMQNRRAFPRYRGRVRVQYVVADDEGGATRIAYTGDVGPTGCHVVTTSPVRPGAALELEVSLPAGRTVKMRGVVRWAKQVPPRLSRLGHGGFGVQLEEPPEPWYAYCWAMQQRADQLAGRGQARAGGH